MHQQPRHLCIYCTHATPKHDDVHISMNRQFWRPCTLQCPQLCMYMQCATFLAGNVYTKSQLKGLKKGYARALDDPTLPDP